MVSTTQDPPTTETETEKPGAVEVESRKSRSPRPPPAFITRYFPAWIGKGWTITSLKTLVRCMFALVAGLVLLFTQRSLVLLGQVRQDVAF